MIVLKLVFNRRRCQKDTRLLKKIEKNVSETIGYGEKIINSYDEKMDETERRVSEIERKIDFVLSEKCAEAASDKAKTTDQSDIDGCKTEKNGTEVGK